MLCLQFYRNQHHKKAYIQLFFIHLFPLNSPALCLRFIHPFSSVEINPFPFFSSDDDFQTPVLFRPRHTLIRRLRTQCSASSSISNAVPSSFCAAAFLFFHDFLSTQLPGSACRPATHNCLHWSNDVPASKTSCLFATTFENLLRWILVKFITTLFLLILLDFLIVFTKPISHSEKNCHQCCLCFKLEILPRTILNTGTLYFMLEVLQRGKKRT